MRKTQYFYGIANEKKNNEKYKSEFCLCFFFVNAKIFGVEYFGLKNLQEIPSIYLIILLFAFNSFLW